MRRSGAACRQCRIGKRRCDKPVGKPCQACVKRNLQCSICLVTRTNINLQPARDFRLQVDQLTHEDRHLHSSKATPARENGCILKTLDHSTVNALLELYIEYIHDKPHSLFHVPTLRADVLSGAIDSKLLCSILALAARFAESQETRALGPRLFEQAKREMKLSLEDISLSMVQTWIVLGNVCGAELESESESLFFGIAIRAAHILGLGKHCSDDNAVLRETKSRVWWSLYMIDTWSAAGLGTPRQMGGKRTTHDLPFDEYAFHALSVGQASWPVTPEPGLWAYMITLVEKFGPIQDLNNLIAEDRASGMHVLSSMKKISSDLDTWEAGLPATVRLTVDTVAYHKARGQGRTFVALHLGYHHYATLLYYNSLDRSASSWASQLSEDQAEAYAYKCRHHACALSDLLCMSYKVGQCEAMYNIVGHMAVVSSSVLIHTLLFAGEDQLPAAKARLESNFAILMKLKSWWPSVQNMADRLLLFQNACLRSADKCTHILDHWMVKFLLEHAIVLGDKTETSLLEATSPQSIGSTGGVLAQEIFRRGKYTRAALTSLRNV
ncbi:hypothetical protein M433DRAFT_156962 [Acidomyces richmondensis BFW]|nr:MAG: hypothetical protein FE78DRAFT_93981 [Acidomyces sp. 'richmondensis']KYG43277.1 hypothetical protein M433DRAFT_156962 [Acidomyces richmondensis BFW]